MRSTRRDIPVRERLIFALDVPNTEEAHQLIDHLDDSVQFYKIGLELFAAGAAFELIETLQARGKRIFLDLKLFDIPQTVGAAVRRLAGRGIDLVTVHAGDDAILRAASDAAAQSGDKSDKKDGRKLEILAVTVLTSIAAGSEEEVRNLVLARARQARDQGCAGVVASGLEASALRSELGDDMLIVVPGIRPAKNRPADDQKRTVDVEEAFEQGADHIVVGRPIRTAAQPHQAAEAIQARIAAHFRR